MYINKIGSFIIAKKFVNKTSLKVFFHQPYPTPLFAQMRMFV